MVFRDDRDALLARLEVLERDAARVNEVITRNHELRFQIAELEAENHKLRYEVARLTARP
ncbi:MAG: hypothetical protein WKG01_35175 [Kofleriaceae bacterium]